jgi:hypothetical protein
VNTARAANAARRRMRGSVSRDISAKGKRGRS